MSRPKRCKLCTGDAAILGAVNDLIGSGVKQRAIHKQYPAFSVSQISRHSRFCLQAKSVELTAPAASAEISKWLERADRTFLLAEANQDSKAAVAAISAATRGLAALSKQLEKEIEQENSSPDSPNKPATIADFNRLAEDFLAKRDLENGGVAEKSQCLLMESPEFSQLVLNIWKDRSTLPALLAASDTNYLQREPTNAVAND